jgi:glycosyltransferase involved in cell wall biosynthesis
VNLAFKLIGLRAAGKQFTVYLYVLSGPLNLIASMLCQALGISLVQEMCEWWATDMRSSSLTRWLFRSRMFKASTGLLVISKEIEQRAQERAAMLNPRLTIHRLPSVVDFDRFCAPVAPPQPGETHMPNFVWCGSIDGWMTDIKFMLAALAHARLTHACQLTLVGAYSEANAAIIKKEAAALGLVVTEPRDSGVAYGDLSDGDVRLTGWVDLETLQACFRNAAALLLPLFDNERSRTRMPNKLPEYLASCKPVITSKVGDLQDFLVDGVNASLAKPGDSVDFACRMTALLADPELATRIGTAGRQTCAQNLDYRAHVACLAEFFGNCLRKPAHLRAEGISP